MFASKKDEARKRWREDAREGGMKLLLPSPLHKTSEEYGLMCCVFFPDLIHFFNTCSVQSVILRICIEANVDFQEY